MTDLERELKSAERDYAEARAHYDQCNEKLQAAVAWVEAAIERAQAARFAVRASALTQLEPR